MLPTVSVITVSYNSVSTIEHTIESVRAQTYPNLEYIVVDGGSSDGTVAVLKNHAAVIDWWVSEPDKGIYDAMNKGIQKSSGDIIGIINSDDWYERDAVETAVRTFQEHSDVDLVHGAMKVWNEDGSLHAQYGSRQGIPPEWVSPFNHPTCFVRRSVYQDLGVFDSNYPTAADYEFMLRFIGANRKDLYVDRVLANFRLGGVTTQYSFSLYRQLWKVLRQNDRGGWTACKALLFRSVRDVAVCLTDWLSLQVLRDRLRPYVPYHNKSRKGRKG